MRNIKILELFGGIGALTEAFKNTGVCFEVVDYVEIDKYAVASYNAINGTKFEAQDICKWDKDVEVDLIMHGSPCQDFSLVGKQAGADEGSGTRSSLMYETIRIVSKLRPKYVIWENVKNVASKKHIHNFTGYLDKMSELGYTSYATVLNAKDYGVAQHRERVFVVSMLDDDDDGFEFPKCLDRHVTMRDVLESDVDDKYYLSDKMIRYISAIGTCGFKNADCKINLDVARPLTTCPNKRAGTTNYISDDLPSGYDLSSLEVDYRLGYDSIRIRRLTPREYWRLMGFSDDSFNKAREVCSDTRLYQQAGNSIVVPILEGIINNLLKIDKKDLR